MFTCVPCPQYTLNKYINLNGNWKCLSGPIQNDLGYHQQCTYPTLKNAVVRIQWINIRHQARISTGVGCCPSFSSPAPLWSSLANPVCSFLLIWERHDQITIRTTTTVIRHLFTNMPDNVLSCYPHSKAMRQGLWFISIYRRWNRSLERPSTDLQFHGHWACTIICTIQTLPFTETKALPVHPAGPSHRK